VSSGAGKAGKRVGELIIVTIHGIWSMIIKAALSKGVKYAN